MLKPLRDTIICEVLARTRRLASGLWLAEKIKSEDNKDNVVRCIEVGEGMDKSWAGSIVHYKQQFGKKFTYESRKLISLKKDEIIAIEKDDKVIAVGSMVIVKLQYAEKSGSIWIPDNAKQNSGDFTGEVVSVGPEYPDKDLKRGDRIIYLRGEGYRFRTYEGRQDLKAVKEKWIYGVDKYANRNI